MVAAANLVEAADLVEAMVKVVDLVEAMVEVVDLVEAMAAVDSDSAVVGLVMAAVDSDSAAVDSDSVAVADSVAVKVRCNRLWCKSPNPHPNSCCPY